MRKRCAIVLCTRLTPRVARAEDMPQTPLVRSRWADCIDSVSEAPMGTNRLRALCALTCCALAAAGLAACGSGSGGSGSGKSISIWEGWTGAEQKEFTHLVAAYEKANPG